MIVNQRQLHGALAKCASVTDRKATLPALANVRIVGGELTASDLMRTVICRVDVSGIDDVSCLVPTHDLLARVGNLDGDVTITHDGTELVVTSGRRRYALHTQPIESYPTIALPSDGDVVSIDGATLLRAIDGSLYAALANDSTREHMCAVSWESDGGRMVLVASDGHRLAHCRTDVEWNHTVLVPRDSCAAIRKFIDRAELVHVRVSDGLLSVAADRNTIAVKLSPDQFVPWRQIVGSIQSTQSITVDASEFASALTAVGVSAPERMGRVMLRTDDGLRVEASSPDLGDASDTVPADGSTPADGWGCAAQYLHDAVRSLDGDVTLETSGTLDPLLVRHEVDMVAVVMPVRM